VQDDRGTQHTCVILNTWGGVSLPSPVPCALAPCIHPASSCLRRWCGVLVIPGLRPSSLVHPYLSCSTPFHPMSNCSWQRLGVLCGAGFVVSPPHPPFVLISLSSPRLAPPRPLQWWQHLPGVAVILRHSLAAVLGSCWCCVGFGSIVLLLLTLSPPLHGGGPSFVPPGGRWSSSLVMVGVLHCRHLIPGRCCSCRCHCCHHAVAMVVVVVVVGPWCWRWHWPHLVVTCCCCLPSPMCVPGISPVADSPSSSWC
jgi:hypothetical protein